MARVPNPTILRNKLRDFYVKRWGDSEPACTKQFVREAMRTIVDGHRRGYSQADIRMNLRDLAETIANEC